MSSFFLIKTRKILNFLLFIFYFLTFRLWYLTIVKHEEHLDKSKRTQYHNIVEFPKRGLIRDRFNVPLAVNKIQYDVALYFDAIRRSSGLKNRKERKKYVTRLAHYLGSELSLSPSDVEDMIYSYAASTPNELCLLQKDVHETTYYRLRAREKDWPGYKMQISSKRYYPEGDTASNVLGYLGKMNQREHHHLQKRMHEISRFLCAKERGIPSVLPKGCSNFNEVKKQLRMIKDTMNFSAHFMGRSGLERQFEEYLRGKIGVKRQEIDIFGRCVREMPDSMPSIPGKGLLLTLSVELQRYAEKLLMEREKTRGDSREAEVLEQDGLVFPWIRGGAIVAMIPETGEVVAMASSPTCNFNDFCHAKNSFEIIRNLETANYVGHIWDGICIVDKDKGWNIDISGNGERISLDYYLKSILSKHSSVKEVIQSIFTLRKGVDVQNLIHALWTWSGEMQIHPLIDALFPPENGNKISHFHTSKAHRKNIISMLREKVPSFERFVADLSSFLSRITYNDDKILVLDILQIICPHHLFNDSLLLKVGETSFFNYWMHNRMVLIAQKRVREVVRQLFHERDFQKWREKYFKAYLIEQRREEKKEKKAPKPFLQYLSHIEKEMFEIFFYKYQWQFLAIFFLGEKCIQEDDAILAPYIQAIIADRGRHHIPSSMEETRRFFQRFSYPVLLSYLRTMRSFAELNRSLLGRYAHGISTEQDLAKAFYPLYGYGFSKSFAFQEVGPLGSIFKIITGYEALRQDYLCFQDNVPNFLNPLTIIDQPFNDSSSSSAFSVLGYFSDGAPIPRMYKGGRLPKSHRNIGQVNIQRAFECSSNVYFACLAADCIRSPTDLQRAASWFGFGQKSGILLPGEAKGHVPQDLSFNKTALYSFAIGHHTLVVTPLQTTACLSALANGGHLMRPQIIKAITGMERESHDNLFFSRGVFQFQEYLRYVGIYFPLFSKGKREEVFPCLQREEKQEVRQVYLPSLVRETILRGLYDVVNGDNGTARAGSIDELRNNPSAKYAYERISPYMAGKTSTAEIFYRPFLDKEGKVILCHHTWFGGMVFGDPGIFHNDSLVVVVYLRFGKYGKEAAPIAAKVIQKWREIQSKHQCL